jgi:adenylate cyclase
MPSPFARKLIQGLAAGIIGTVLAAGLWAAGILDRWESFTWDWRAGILASPSPAADHITLILLDQNSLDWGQQENGLSWPWPREVYAAVIEFCKRQGTRSLAMDVLFTEPSAYGVSDDAALAAAAAEFGSVAGAVALSPDAGSASAWPMNVLEPAFPVIPANNTHNGLPIFSRAAFPIPELSKAMAVLCNTRMNPDADGIYRKAMLAAMFDGRLMPSLGLGAYLAAHPSTAVRIGADSLAVGDRTIPISPSGEAILRFSGPAGTYRSFSAAAVIQSELRLRAGDPPTIDDPGAFRDKYVFFGFSAPGLFDLRPTPVDGITPGVEIQAAILENLLSGNFMRRCPTSLWLTVTFVLAAAAGMAGSIFSSAAGFVLISILSIAIPVLSALGGYAGGWALPLVPPEVAVVSVLFLVYMINYATEGRQKRFIQGAFKQYLSPAVIDELILHPERLRLGGERRVLSIFFSDLEGFTALSEKLEPEELTALLNEYLSAMTDIIHEESGTVDKFEGDAIIAFWNAPLEVSDHPLRVVRTALRCQARLAELNPHFQKRVGRELRMRIGIHTGSAVVGNMGSTRRFDYTMLGDAVNLASRLEGANKAFGTYTMISEGTLDGIGPAFPVREIARLAVVGRKEPITVFEPMLHELYDQRQPILDIFDQGLRLFYAGRFLDAEQAFASIADQDVPAQRYMDKCRHYQVSPPETWGGVWVMTSK